MQQIYNWGFNGFLMYKKHNVLNTKHRVGSTSWFLVVQCQTIYACCRNMCERQDRVWLEEAFEISSEDFTQVLRKSFVTGMNTPLWSLKEMCFPHIPDISWDNCSQSVFKCCMCPQMWMLKCVNHTVEILTCGVWAQAKCNNLANSMWKEAVTRDLHRHFH